MARNSLPSSSDSRNPFGGDRGITPVTDIKPRSINREEAAAYWLDTCGLEIPPPEPWNPVRPRVGWTDAFVEAGPELAADELVPYDANFIPVPFGP
ncbi:hypothetical protein YC2023_098804 [Brassica napus]